jgi:hypothetical protein
MLAANNSALLIINTKVKYPETLDNTFKKPVSMKTKLYSTLLALLLTMALVAQPPQKFKYQGVVRDNNGNPLSSKNISLRISLLVGSATGNAVYIETHNTNTNPFGLFNIDVGAGTVITGNFSAIPWSQYDYFQKVEIDTTGGSIFTLMGTSQLLSVPYALMAGRSEYVTYNGFSGMMIFDYTTNWPTYFVTNREENIMVEVWGGGGGGGGTNHGSSGGGGGYGKSIFHLHAGDTILVTVGAGGLGGNGVDAEDGGTSSFGNLISATGGQGGKDGNNHRYTLGGTSNGQFNITGGYGALWIGGDSPNGGGGGVINEIEHSDAVVPGGGGGCIGYNGVFYGGNGAPGRIVIYW